MVPLFSLRTNPALRNMVRCLDIVEVSAPTSSVNSQTQCGFSRRRSHMYSRVGWPRALKIAARASQRICSCFVIVPIVLVYGFWVNSLPALAKVYFTSSLLSLILFSLSREVACLLAKGIIWGNEQKDIHCRGRDDPQ